MTDTKAEIAYKVKVNLDRIKFTDHKKESKRDFLNRTSLEYAQQYINELISALS